MGQSEFLFNELIGLGGPAHGIVTKTTHFGMWVQRVFDVEGNCMYFETTC